MARTTYGALGKVETLAYVEMKNVIPLFKNLGKVFAF
jgi:hypothetical protein